MSDLPEGPLRLGPLLRFVDDTSATIWVETTTSDSAEPVTGIDVTSADMLTELDAALQEAGIELAFAQMKDPVKDELKRFGVYHQLGEHQFFATVREAVDSYRKTHPSEI